jgi:hypothetical protein
MVRYLVGLCLLLSFLVATCLGGAWDQRNDPRNFANDYVYEFNKLLLNATLPVIPYSDTYWPSYQSGIAHRWKREKPEDFGYKFYTKKELMKGGPELVSTLSPAEKYDIFVGRYDFPTVQSEWRRTSPNDYTWEGKYSVVTICCTALW